MIDQHVLELLHLTVLKNPTQPGRSHEYQTRLVNYSINIKLQYWRRRYLVVVDQVLPEYETESAGTETFPNYLNELFIILSAEFNENDMSEVEKTSS